ncbi:MAG: XdhC family protein [Acidobacteriota bacterium]
MNKADIFRKILDLNETGSEFVLVTVTEKKGSGPSVTGGKMIITSDGDTFGTIGGGTLEKLVIKESEKVLSTGKSITKKYLLDDDKVISDKEKTGMLCGGEVSLFLEYSGAVEKIYLFGAGHIGRNMTRLLEGLNFRIIVVDDREEMLDEIPDVNKVHFRDPGTVLNKIGNFNKSFVLIATHSHELDYKILKNIIESEFDPLYLGVVASVKKIDTMISRLKKEIKGNFETDYIYSPAGLDIGGRSPSEIALSIVAEIQSVRYKKRDFRHLSKVPGTDK